jgi:TPR repeat protein
MRRWERNQDEGISESKMKKSRFTEMKIIYKCPKSAYSRKSDVRWRYKYALKGHPLAMYELAMDYLYLHKLGADGAKAMLWLCKAADAGSVDACYELAEIYKCGFLQLHVLSGCESTEKYLITKNHKLAATYMSRAKELERALKSPNGRVLYGAGHGWCYFSPSEKIRIDVSCAYTGDFPPYSTLATIPYLCKIRHILRIFLLNIRRIDYYQCIFMNTGSCIA